MKENKFQTVFTHWLKTRYKETGAFELKVAKNGVLPFSAVQPHQIEALFRAKCNHIAYKLPDCGIQTPFDCISLKSVPSYVVVLYGSRFVLIDIDIFITEKKISKRKSLTEKRAEEIGTFYEIA